MNQWFPITNTAISNYVSKSQLQSLCQYDSLLKNITSDIVAQVRSHIRSNSNNFLSHEEHLVPQELVTTTCHLIIEALQSRIPTLKLSSDQVRNANNARKQLKEVSSGKVTIAQPNIQGSSIKVVKSRGQCVNSKNLGAL